MKGTAGHLCMEVAQGITITSRTRKCARACVQGLKQVTIKTNHNDGRGFPLAWVPGGTFSEYLVKVSD